MEVEVTADPYLFARYLDLHAGWAVLMRIHFAFEKASLEGAIDDPAGAADSVIFDCLCDIEAELECLSE